MTIKKFATDPTDRDNAELLWELKADCCIVSNSTMYLYYRDQWRVIDKKEPHILRTMIGDSIREYFEKQLSITKDGEYTTTLKNLKEICKKTKLSNVTSFVMDKMYSEHRISLRLKIKRLIYRQENPMSLKKRIILHKIPVMIITNLP